VLKQASRCEDACAVLRSGAVRARGVDVVADALRNCARAGG
jgi:hypothetical protein